MPRFVIHDKAVTGGGEEANLPTISQCFGTLKPKLQSFSSVMSVNLAPSDAYFYMKKLNLKR